MDWNKISAASETVAAIAVIISLVYVADQLEQNTKAMQLAAVTNTTEIWASHQLVLAQDEDLNRIFWVGLSGNGSLSERDQKRFESFVSGWVQTFQQSYLLNQTGTLNPGLWQNQLSSMDWFFTNKGARLYWQTWKSAHVPSFVQFVDERISTSSAAPANNP